MRIAIISLPLSFNYGGYLQCYALMETLREMGHEVFYLQRENGNKLSIMKGAIDSLKCVLERIGLGTLVYVVEKGTNSGLFYKTKNFRAFADKYIKTVSPVLRNTEDVLRYCKKHHMEAYITGSDQIWRKQYSRSVFDAFLGFAPVDAIKIAYAPSLGTNQWDYNAEETQFIQSQLNTFRAISVREKDGIRLLEENMKLRLTPQYVLDPTFLLLKEHYLKIAQNVPHRKGVLTYVLNSNEKKEKAIMDFCKSNRLDAYSVINPKTNTDCIADGQGYPVECWLAGFRDADHVLTDSFHATVFSIIFNKPFWVFENAARGNSRLLDILRTFECEDRLITEDVDWKQLEKRFLNWEKINEIKSALQHDSMNFLESALRNDRTNVEI